MTLHGNPTLLHRPALCLVTALALVGLSASAATAQTKFNVQAHVPEAPPSWLHVRIEDPNSPEMRRYSEQQRHKQKVAQELKKIRHQFFRAKNRADLRQEGIAQLRDYATPENFEALLDVFKDQGHDVYSYLVNTYQDAQSLEGDACLAWIAVYDERNDIRELAEAGIRTRVDTLGEFPDAAAMVVHSGLASKKQHAMTHAAQLADRFDLARAIPWLIASQVGPVGGGQPTRGTDGDLAWIAIGTQQAFVSDLTPVVSESAVAFDPQLDVVTSGTVLRVRDAIVYEYRTEIHYALTSLTSRLTDTNTKPFGWDNPKWTKWFTEEFPALREAKLAAEKAAAEEAAEPNTSPKAPD